MKIALGTGNLGQNYNVNYQNVVNYSVTKSFPLHISLDYNVNEKYLTTNLIESNKPIFILKLTVIKNIFKLKTHIKKQIEQFQKIYKVNYIGYIQICDNPPKNYIYQYFLKRIILDYKKKGIISKIYLDVFPDYEKNLNYLINEDFYEGFIFLFNFKMRSITKEFFYRIINSKKKMIIYSPLSSGELIRKTENNNNRILINCINFFKSISNSLEYVIFGTKKIERIKFFETSFKEKENILDKEKIDDIISKQKIFNKY